MADHGDWLQGAMQGTWTELGQRYTMYRDSIVDCVRGCADDTVIFSALRRHRCRDRSLLGDDRLVIRRLDNCSVTTVAIESGQFRLVTGGNEADTLIR